MALRINTARTFDTPVTVHFHDDSGQPAKGTFGATFKVQSFEQMKAEENSDKTLLDLVLVSIKEDELELVDEVGQVLKGEALLKACKTDPSISAALITAYNEAITKKNLKRT